MKEKRQQIEKKPMPGDDAGIFCVTPEPESKDVSVSSGPYIENLPLAGMTVGEVRKRYSDRFDIDEKAIGIVDGKDADESHCLKAGEALMFVRHAGEKGGSNYIVTIDGETVTAKTPEGQYMMKLDKLLERSGKSMDTGDCILPTGVKAILSRGSITVLVWEKAPAIQKLSWIRADSPRPYGPGTKYRNVRIALPYLVIFAVFGRDAHGMPCIIKSDECFFRNSPLKSIKDELLYPALLNCSKWTNPTDTTPLSWICTQYLKNTPQMASPVVGERYCAGLEAVRYCLLETSFNLSSEHHEGNSWFGASKKVIPAIGTIEKWEEATKKDPMFVLDTQWIPTNHSVAQVAERIFKRAGATDVSVRTSNDLARIIVNA